ncbi:hypothetical protein TKK_0018312 [Trichogramma kaykai]
MYFRTFFSLLVSWLFFAVCLITTLSGAICGLETPAASIATIGSKKLATASDCSKPVAFSSVTPTVKDGDLFFNETLLDSGVGYNTESGVFTTHCPGLYQLSYFYNGDVKLTLRQKPRGSETWYNVISKRGGEASSDPPLSGNIVLLRLALGDQVALFADGENINAESSFSGFRIARE